MVTGIGVIMSETAREKKREGSWQKGKRDQRSNRTDL
jgi:hypothetical protein